MHFILNQEHVENDHPFYSQPRARPVWASTLFSTLSTSSMSVHFILNQGHVQYKNPFYSQPRARSVWVPLFFQPRARPVWAPTIINPRHAQYERPLFSKQGTSSMSVHYSQNRARPVWASTYSLYRARRVWASTLFSIQDLSSMSVHRHVEYEHPLYSQLRTSRVWAYTGTSSMSVHFILNPGYGEYEIGVI